jgi:cytochrome b subunit of formate dehydrogenase
MSSEAIRLVLPYWTSSTYKSYVGGNSGGDFPNGPRDWFWLILSLLLITTITGGVMFILLSILSKTPVR